MYHIDISTNEFSASFMAPDLCHDEAGDTLTIGKYDEILHIPNVSKWQKVEDESSTTYVNCDKSMTIMIF